MENEGEGLPVFLAAIVAAAILGVLVVAGVILHAILTM